MRRLLALRLEALGLVALAVAVAVIATLLAFLNRAFTESVRVTASIPLTGAPLPAGSEVKARGVVVGRVTAAKVEGAHGVLTLELDPGNAALLPANVTSRALPTTLFGKEFLDLVLPDTPQGSLVEGAVIREDSRPQSIETQKLLADTFPLLSSLHPAELNAALTAVSQALSGRGEQIGQTLDTLDRYLRELAPHYPALTHDLRALATVSDDLAHAVPDLAGTVDSVSTTTRTLAEKQGDLARFLANGATASTALEGLLHDNENRLIALGPALQQTLLAFNSNRPGLAATVKSIPDFLGTLVRVSGGKPYFRIELQLDGLTRGVYTAADCPRYPGADGPNCPSSATTTTTPRYGGSTGSVGSAQERRTVQDLAGPLLGVPAADVPSAADLLLGPLLRGSLVTLR